MNLKSKTHLETQKTAAEGKLAARLALLKDKGLDEGAIGRGAMVRKLKADVRKANQRLARIAALEKFNADKAQAKAEKLAAEKAAREAPAAAPAEPAPAPEKKPKKEKKEKQKKA